MSSSEQAFWLKHLGAADQFTAWVGSEIQPHIGRAVLEIGCGTGTFTRLFAAGADRVVALDIDPGFVDTARAATANLPQVHVECSDALRADLPKGLDTVVMLDVLEHLPDDVAMLKKLRGSLAPGGRIVLKVPAMPSLFSPMDRAIGHYRRYSPRSLRQALDAAGFTPTVCKSFNVLGILGWWLNGRVLGRTTPPADQVKLFDMLTPWLRRIEQAVRPPIGLSLIAVATRTD
jgi:SAM-dependent methyltransferase